MSEEDKDSLKRKREEDKTEVRVEDGSESENESENEENGELCVICMEGPTEGVEIFGHNCPRCVPNAWKVCERCDFNTLSRTCPLCNGDYAPLVFHVTPNEHQLMRKISDMPIHKQGQAIKALNAIKIKLISESSVAVWNSEKNVIYFSLPIDSTLPPKDVRYTLHTLSLDDRTQNTVAIGDDGKVICKVILNYEDIKKSLIDRGIFNFNNKIWDKLEEIQETGEGNEVSQSDIREAMKFILNALSDNGTRDYSANQSGAVLLTCLPDVDTQISQLLDVDSHAEAY